MPISVWWMVAPRLGLNFQLLFCCFSSWADIFAGFEGQRGECKAATVIFSGLHGPSSLWCMKPWVSPRLQYVWVAFLTLFYVVFVVMLCIVKQEQTTKSVPVWNTYCQLLSDLLGSGVMWTCLMWLLWAPLVKFLEIHQVSRSQWKTQKNCNVESC